MSNLYKINLRTFENVLFKKKSFARRAKEFFFNS
jgi:hypothetical protein